MDGGRLEQETEQLLEEFLERHHREGERDDLADFANTLTLLMAWKPYEEDDQQGNDPVNWEAPGIGTATPEE